MTTTAYMRTRLAARGARVDGAQRGPAVPRRGASTPAARPHGRLTNDIRTLPFATYVTDAAEPDHRYSPTRVMAVRHISTNKHGAGAASVPVVRKRRRDARRKAVTPPLWMCAGAAVGVAAAFAGCGGGTRSAGCGGSPAGHRVVLQAPPSAPSDALATTAERICQRGRALNLQQLSVRVLPGRRVEVSSPTLDPLSLHRLTARSEIAFYDWEKDLLSGNPNMGIIGLLPAVQFAARQHDRVETTDLPPRGPSARVTRQFGGNQEAIQAYYDRGNDTAGNKFFLFGPGTPTSRQAIPPGARGTAVAAQSSEAAAYYDSCAEIVQDFKEAGPTRGARRQGATGPPAAGTACRSELAELAGAGLGPPSASIVVEVPQGVTIIKDQQATTDRSVPVNDYFVVQDDSELSDADTTEPKAGRNPQTGAPDVTINLTAEGRAAFAHVTKRLAQRGAQTIRPPGTPQSTSFQHFAITLDNQIASLAYVDSVQNPEGIDGSNGAEIDNLATVADGQRLTRLLAVGALPLTLTVASFGR